MSGGGVGKPGNPNIFCCNKSEKYWRDEWNKKHIAYCKKGADYRNKKMADYCEELIVKADDLYYNTGNVLMEDSEYDKIRYYLKILRPDSSVLQKVGAEIK